jgi:hypothetical protein
MRGWNVMTVALALLAVGQGASAQTIEKMKLTDGELTCPQLYAESTLMDTVIRANLGAPTAAAAPQAAAYVPGGNNTQAIMQNNNLARQDLMMAQQMMLQSKDVRVRAAASDPQSVAQYAAMLRNPQLAVAAQRAAAAGVSPSFIQSQLAIAGVAQQAAAGSAYGVVPPAPAGQETAGAIAMQGQRYRQLVMAGVPWQQALAQAQAETQGAAPQPHAPSAQAPVAPSGGSLGTQAQARKEHLTALFLNKGCKMSDIQK